MTTDQLTEELSAITSYHETEPALHRDFVTIMLDTAKSVIEKSDRIAHTIQALDIKHADRPEVIAELHRVAEITIGLLELHAAERNEVTHA